MSYLNGPVADEMRRRSKQNQDRNEMLALSVRNGTITEADKELVWQLAGEITTCPFGATGFDIYNAAIDLKYQRDYPDGS